MKFITQSIFLYLTLLAAFGAGVVLSDEPTPTADPFLIVQRTVYKALDDESLIERAQSQLDQLSTEGSSQRLCEIRMYKSLVKALRAEQSFWPVKRLRLIKEALAEMDKEVEEQPANFEFRMLRASTWFEIPEFLGKHDQGVSELQALAGDFEKATAKYSDFLKSHWLSFFLENKLAPDESRFKALYLQSGGKIEDLG